MAIYLFRCNQCGTLREEAMHMATATFGDLMCPNIPCDGRCVYQFPGAPAVATVNMTNPSFDVVVGADAEKRWGKIHERQEQRDRVRRVSGERALKATSVTDFQPLRGARLTGVPIPFYIQDKELR